VTSLGRFVFVVFVALVAGICLTPTAVHAAMGDHGKTVLFGNLYVRPDEVVNGDVNVVFGNAEIAGRVRGDVNTIFGRCVKDEGAVIDGEEHCLTGEAAQAFLPWINTPAFMSFADQDKRLLVRLGSSAIVLLMFLLFPMRMRLAHDRVERHPGLAAAVGILAAIAAVPIALVLLVSIVGIPLIALEIAALLGGVWLGSGAVALVVGRRLSELVVPSVTPSPLWALVLGLVVVSAAETVPFVGWAVTAIVWVVGLGASILACLRSAFVERVRATIGGPPMRSA
jgi:hypothetical protein